MFEHRLKALAAVASQQPTTDNQQPTSW